MIKIIGSGGISATIIADSLNKSGNRFTTFEIEYPRFILAELNTHCMLEKNTASSRAIPVEAMLKLIEATPAMPVHWGENNPGMKSKRQLDQTRTEAAMMTWVSAAKQAVAHSKVLAEKEGINAHKQISNRVTEPYQFSKTVISGTEWANFFWLRLHPDAQPEFQELARVMSDCLRNSSPELLLPGEWHLPYVKRLGNTYWLDTTTQINLETAKKVSASCCAQVSYRKLNDTVEQAEKVFAMLNLGSQTDPAHASPICHQATPMFQSSHIDKINDAGNVHTWEPGVTHMRRDYSLWSGKLQGWIQYRQLFENEAKW